MSLDKQTVCKKVGTKIREIRTNKGLSIEKLANEAVFPALQGVESTEVRKGLLKHLS